MHLERVRAASSTEHFKRAVCYPGPLCFKDGCLISEVWMLRKKVSASGASFEFLTAQNNFPSNARTRGQRGEGEEERRREKVRRLSEAASGSPGPSAELRHINVSQFGLTWESGY